MDGNTHRNLSDPGAVPGASTHLSPDSPTGIGPTTEQCSVEIAKVLPTGDRKAPEGTGSPLGGTALAAGDAKGAEGGPSGDRGLPPDGLPVLALDTVGDGEARFCPKCLEYGDQTAVDCRAPAGTLCEYHQRSGRLCARVDCVRERAADSMYCRGHDLCARTADRARLQAAADTAGDIGEYSEPGCHCCHRGFPCQCCPLHWTPVEKAAQDLARLVLRSLERKRGDL